MLSGVDQFGIVELRELLANELVDLGLGGAGADSSSDGGSMEPEGGGESEDEGEDEDFIHLNIDRSNKIIKLLSEWD